MKYLIQPRLSVMLIVILITVSLQNIYACGACSGNMGNLIAGQLVYQQSHSIGFTTNARYFEADVMTHVGDHSMELANWKEGHYSFDINGVYFFNKNLAAMVNLPFIHKVRFKNNELQDSYNGIGDLYAGMQYHIVNRFTNTDSTKKKHRLTIGGGVEFPTGKHNKSGYNGRTEPHLQPGSGSFDFQFDLNYLLMGKRFGFNTFTSYKINTENSNHFKFANTLNVSVQTFYHKNVKNWGFVPTIGVNFEQAGFNRLYDMPYNLDTGAYLYSITCGGSIVYKNVGFTGTYYLPVYQNLNGSQLENTNRFVVSIKYLFNN